MRVALNKKLLFFKEAQETKNSVFSDSSEQMY